MAAATAPTSSSPPSQSRSSSRRAAARRRRTRAAAGRAAARYRRRIRAAAVVLLLVIVVPEQQRVAVPEQQPVALLFVVVAVPEQQRSCCCSWSSYPSSSGRAAARGRRTRAAAGRAAARGRRTRAAAGRAAARGRRTRAAAGRAAARGRRTRAAAGRAAAHYRHRIQAAAVVLLLIVVVPEQQPVVLLLVIVGVSEQQQHDGCCSSSSYPSTLSPYPSGSRRAAAAPATSSSSSPYPSRSSRRAAVVTSLSSSRPSSSDPLWLAGVGCRGFFLPSWVRREQSWWAGGDADVDGGWWEVVGDRMFGCQHLSQFMFGIKGGDFGMSRISYLISNQMKMYTDNKRALGIRVECLGDIQNQDDGSESGRAERSSQLHRSENTGKQIKQTINVVDLDLQPPPPPSQHSSSPVSTGQDLKKERVWVWLEGKQATRGDPRRGRPARPEGVGAQQQHDRSASKVRGRAAAWRPLRQTPHTSCALPSARDLGQRSRDGDELGKDPRSILTARRTSRGTTSAAALGDDDDDEEEPTSPTPRLLPLRLFTLLHDPTSHRAPPLVRGMWAGSPHLRRWYGDKPAPVTAHQPKRRHDECFVVPP
ncbi:hypothetical protein BDZ97DRAFT_1763922 [Flammula alnicola]|nr:hypothetical protein BDZ97DRAFT_1763922 [Flammula alnicola]